MAPPDFKPWAMPWKKEAIHYYHVDGVRHRIRAEYGLRQDDSQRPYFFIIGRTGRRRHSMSIGEEIEAYFPDLSRFVKWHLVSESGPPWYPKNGIFWWEVIKGLQPKPEYSGDPWEAFREAIVFGALDGDELPPLEATSEEVEEWLLSRLPYLRIAFRRAMAAAYNLDLD